MTLLLHNIRLPLASFTLKLDVSLNHHVTGIFGSSGAGKTSLLDLAAGLRRAESARIQLGDQLLTDTAQRIEVPAHRRRIGYVPQDLALFPHLSVRQNLLYGCPAESEERFSYAHVTELLEIGGLAGRRIHDLSGGEKQRVALGRALLASPQLLILDEPLTSLDYALKRKVLPYLSRIRDEYPLPMLYVSHDPSELAELCDEILVLERGEVIAQGKPDETLPRLRSP